MKIYVVADRAYLSEEKAEKYKELMGYDDDIEEYETSDDAIDVAEPIWLLRSIYNPENDKIKFETFKMNTLDDGDHGRASINYCELWGREITINKWVSRIEGESKEDVIKRFGDRRLKVSRDYWDIIKEQILNGATEDDIYRVLSEKSDELNTNEQI